MKIISGYADFAENNDFIAELLRRRAEDARHARGRDLHYQFSIDFLDAVNGATKLLNSAAWRRHSGGDSGRHCRGADFAPAREGGAFAGEGDAGDALVEISINPHQASSPGKATIFISTCRSR